MASPEYVVLNVEHAPHPDRPAVMKRRAIAVEVAPFSLIDCGEVQRHLIALNLDNPDFWDGDVDERLDHADQYLFVPRFPLARLDLEEFELDEERAAQMAERTTPVPAIVINDGCSFIDGVHRANAQKIKGLDYVPAFVGVPNPKRMDAALRELIPAEARAMLGI